MNSTRDLASDVEGLPSHTHTKELGFFLGNPYQFTCIPIFKRITEMGQAHQKRLGRKMSKDMFRARRMKSLVEWYVSRIFNSKVDPSDRKLSFVVLRILRTVCQVSWSRLSVLMIILILILILFSTTTSNHI